MTSATLAPAPVSAPTDGLLDVTVLMPCLNESRTLPACIQKATKAIQELGLRGEVLIADNGSTDNSVALAESLGARVVVQSARGYGNALRKGFAEARGRFVIMGDADESYDFLDIKRFIDLLEAGADLVMGNRLRGEIKPKAMPWLHRWVGNPGLTWLLNLMFRTGIHDTQCGMRGLRREAYSRLHMHAAGMEFASEMVIKASVAGLRIEEIPITLWPDGRDRRPHLRSFRDGWRHLRFMLMCSPTFLFLIPGALLTCVGLLAIPIAVLAGYGVWDNVFGPNFLYTASLVSLSGAHLMSFGFLAKLHAHRVDPVFRNPLVGKLAGQFSVEVGLVVGTLLMVAGILVGLPVLIHWLWTTEVKVPGQWIFGGTLFCLGLEAIFAAFLVSILDWNREEGN